MADVHELLSVWIENVKDEELLAELKAMKEAGDEEAITDAFFQELAFGTAGLRGTLGAGTNRMNIYTVGRATQGFADYLVKHFEKPTVPSHATVATTASCSSRPLRRSWLPTA